MGNYFIAIDVMALPLGFVLTVLFLLYRKSKETTKEDDQFPLPVVLIGVVEIVSVLAVAFFFGAFSHGFDSYFSHTTFYMNASLGMGLGLVTLSILWWSQKQ